MAEAANNPNQNTAPEITENNTTGIVKPPPTDDDEVNDLISFLEGESTTKRQSRTADDGSSSSSSKQPGDSAPQTRSSTPPSQTTNEDTSDYSDREKQLLARIEELTQEKLDRNKPAEQSEPEFQAQTHDFLEGLDIDEVLSSSDNLNKLLLGVYNKALQESSKLSAENIMRSLPSTMSNYVSQHLSMRELVTQFYDDNPELKDAKKTVTAVVNK